MRELNVKTMLLQSGYSKTTVASLSKGSMYSITSKKKCVIESVKSRSLCQILVEEPLSYHLSIEISTLSTQGVHSLLLNMRSSTRVANLTQVKCSAAAMT